MNSLRTNFTSTPCLDARLVVIPWTSVAFMAISLYVPYGLIRYCFDSRHLPLALKSFHAISTARPVPYLCPNAADNNIHAKDNNMCEVGNTNGTRKHSNPPQTAYNSVIISWSHRPDRKTSSYIKPMRDYFKQNKNVTNTTDAAANKGVVPR